MGINERATHEDDSEEEDDEESSGDESYDYGFAGDDNDEDEEDSDYEVDYTRMNVSPEILRMLGASEEVIAAKEAEIAGVTSTWVPPTETGLEHSAAIADSSAVAIGPGAAADGGAVKRVFKSVGAFENEGTGDAAAPAENLPVMKVKITKGPEPVPKKWESKLPPRDEDNDADGDGDDSDDSWDETSVIDGHAWWESDSEDERILEEGPAANVSANLRAVLGLGTAAGGEAATAGGGEGGNSNWRPPEFSGLANSKRLQQTLKPLVVGQNNKALEVEYSKKAPGEDDEDAGGWSEEEGWDYEDVPDDEYLLDWSTNISPNLAKAMGRHPGEKKVTAISAELSWRPPPTSGLKNSAPIITKPRPFRLES